MCVSWTEHLQFGGADIRPRVSQNIFRGKTSLRILLEELSKKLASASRDVLWELKFTCADLLIELLVI